MPYTAAEQGSIDAVVSSAVERLICEYYRNDSAYFPKKETEAGVRRFLEIRENEPCADVLLQSWSDQRTFKIVDGKASSDLEKLERQFGCTAAALLIGPRQITRIYFEVFARIGPVPYERLRSEHPGIEKRDSTGSSREEVARQRFYAGSVFKMLEVVTSSDKMPTKIGRSAFAEKSYQNERILVDNTMDVSRTPSAVLPEFATLGQLTSRTAALNRRIWGAEKFAALTGKLSPHTTVKLVRFKPEHVA